MQNKLEGKYMHTQQPQAGREIDWDSLPPEHPVCENQVEVPTLRLQPRGQGYPHRPAEFEWQEEIVVQWFGKSWNDSLKDLQFAFPLLTNPDSIQWFGRPEWYRVVMLGTLEGWPNKDAIPKFLKSGATMESIYAYIITAQIGLDDGRGGTVPTAKLVQVTELGDPIHGIITPRVFANWEIPKEEIAKLSSRGR